MIRPTVGRIMWYWPIKERRGAEPLAAIVTCVHGDHMVNFCVFEPNGMPSPRTSVPIVQDGSPHSIGDSPYAEWMPYQLGQAAKTEAALKA